MLSENDPPLLTDPQEGYIKGCTTQTPCGTLFSTYVSDGPDFYFGQFWRWEALSDPLVIRGLKPSDPDADEQCLFSSSKPCNFLLDPASAYQCGRLDLKARALIGAISLNTRDDLSFYEQERSSLGFTAQVRYISAAVQGIFYRVDTADTIATGQSRVLDVNTQHVGSPQEFILIRLSDQVKIISPLRICC